MQLSINGESRTVALDPRTALIDVLRDSCRLTGAKPVCREGFCGACTVHIDGVPQPSCLLPIGGLAGKAITTIEGVAPYTQPNAIQQAFLDHDAVQCGMCFPGMVMTLSHFLDHNPAPSREEVKTAMVGNVCRCTGYERIVDAVLSAAASRGAAE